MTDESFSLERAYFGQAGLALVPETVRQEFFSDPDFLHELDLKLDTKGTATFGANAQFEMGVLYDAVIKCGSEGTSQTIKDRDGEEWTVDIREEDELACLFITKGDTTFRHLEGMLLVDDKERRLAALRLLSEHVCLPRNDRDTWEEKASERPLTPNEVTEFHEDVQDTPIAFSERLSSAIRRAETPLDLFIPESRRYFARLVGPLDESKNLSEHISHGVRQRATELIQGGNHDGLLYALLMGSHTDVVSAIPLDGLTDEGLAEFARTIVVDGDLISKLGTVQTALRRLKECPDLIEPIESLVKNLMGESSDDGNDAYSDLSRFFVFLESEFSKRGICRDISPFYRRMVSLAQASLIQRVLNAEGVDLTSFREWIDANTGPQSFVQAIVDLRREPRWQPEGIDASQLRQEFIGRLLGSGQAFSNEIKDTSLEGLLCTSSKDKGAVASYANFPKPYLPGPLEGQQHTPPQALPEEVQSAFEGHLATSGINERTFAVPINYSTLSVLDKDIPEKIIEKLKVEKFHLHDIEDAEDVAAIILGLGKVACVTRSAELADSVRILVRKYRSDPVHKLSIAEAWRALVMAAASESDQYKWNALMADSLEELALGELTKQEAQGLYSFQYHLTLAEPSLWTVIGRSDAALTSFLQM